MTLRSADSEDPVKEAIVLLGERAYSAGTAAELLRDHVETFCALGRGPELIANTAPEQLNEVIAAAARFESAVVDALESVDRVPRDGRGASVSVEAVLVTARDLGRGALTELFRSASIAARPSARGARTGRSR